jgi:hypothetical protein
LETFSELLKSQITYHNQIKIRLLGDTLADRGPNDIFILLIFQELHRQGIPYEILFSGAVAI